MMYVANEINNTSIVWSSRVCRFVNSITASTVSVITPLRRTIPTLNTKNTIWRISANSVGFEPAIPVIKRLQTSASDHTATGANTKCFTRIYTEILFVRHLIQLSYLDKEGSSCSHVVLGMFWGYSAIDVSSLKLSGLD